jgi:hypothetical protein
VNLAPSRLLPLPAALAVCHTRRYELAYIESTQGVARGQRVWQLAFGSGFKFNSAVLQAHRPIREQHAAWDNFDSEVGRGFWACWFCPQWRLMQGACTYAERTGPAACFAHGSVPGYHSQ